MDEIVTQPEPWSRKRVFLAIAHLADRGLPVPSVQFSPGQRSVSFDLDSIADLDLWLPPLGVEARRQQVYRSKHSGVIRLVNAYRIDWNGWHLSLAAYDPATPEEIADLVAREAIEAIGRAEEQAQADASAFGELVQA
jgi:hypothetical protein